MPEINISYTLFDRFEELNDGEQLLVSKAKEIAKNAYAPYSDFHVGAAVLLESGDVITGSNQENMAYPSGLCAERTALFYAGAQFPGVKVVRLAVFGIGSLQSDGAPVTPCGACRQVISETIRRQNQGFGILLTGSSGQVVKLENALDLLPMPFGFKVK